LFLLHSETVTIHLVFEMLKVQIKCNWR